MKRSLVVLLFWLLLLGCEKKAAPLPTPGPKPECTADAQCPQPDAACERGVCSEGECITSLAKKGTRCPMDQVWAQRQADLHVYELNELGVCVEHECLPRAYCSQLCGGKLASSLQELVEAKPCFESPCPETPEPKPAAVEAAYDGLRDCAFDCGYPYVRRPPASH